jgi:hypothetical protein
MTWHRKLFDASVAERSGAAGAFPEDPQAAIRVMCLVAVWIWSRRDAGATGSDISYMGFGIDASL